MAERQASWCRTRTQRNRQISLRRWTTCIEKRHLRPAETKQPETTSHIAGFDVLPTIVWYQCRHLLHGVNFQRRWQHNWWKSLHNHCRCCQLYRHFHCHCFNWSTGTQNSSLHLRRCHDHHSHDPRLILLLQELRKWHFTDRMAAVDRIRHLCRWILTWFRSNPMGKIQDVFELHTNSDKFRSHCSWWWARFYPARFVALLHPLQLPSTGLVHSLSQKLLLILSVRIGNHIASSSSLNQIFLFFQPLSVVMEPSGSSVSCA